MRPMPPVERQPLSDQDYEKINQELARLDRLRQQIQLALQAGVPCQEQDEECQAQTAWWKKLKSVYFPQLP